MINPFYIYFKQNWTKPESALYTMLLIGRLVGRLVKMIFQSATAQPKWFEQKQYGRKHTRIHLFMKSQIKTILKLHDGFKKYSNIGGGWGDFA